MELLCDDVTRDILKRLPVKSLVKFKCVSKSWCSIISSREFAKSNLELSTGRLFCFTNSCDGVLVSKRDEVEILKARRVKSIQRGWRKVVGSCNGLVCVQNESDKVILWNPATKKTWKLPFSGDRTGGVFDIYKYGFGYDPISDDYKVVQSVFDIYKYGFGYDPISDDYKVVQSKYPVGNRYAGRKRIMIYSARANSWKCVNWNAGLRMDYEDDDEDEVDDDDEDVFGEPGVFVNGCVHWKVYDGDEDEDDQYWSILAIDLATEKCKVIEIPNVQCFDDPDEVFIGGSEKSLCLLSTVEDYMDIWVMRKNGDVDSWTRIVRILNNQCLMGRPTEHFRALERENMPRTLMTGFYEFLIGEPCVRGRDKMFSKLVSGMYEVDSTMAYLAFDCSMYRESLISPN